jgi:peptide deformylase
MRLKIMETGEPVLREAARLLTPQEILGEETQRISREMRDIMRDAAGVGLAAPQLGRPPQLAVIDF